MIVAITRRIFFTKYTLSDLKAEWRELSSYRRFLVSFLIRLVIYLRRGLGAGWKWADITSHVAPQVGTDRALDITFPNAELVSTESVLESTYAQINVKLTKAQATKWDSTALGLVWRSYDLKRLFQFLFAHRGSPPKEVLSGDRDLFTCDEGTVYVIRQADPKLIDEGVYKGLVPISYHFRKFLNR